MTSSAATRYCLPPVLMTANISCLVFDAASRRSPDRLLSVALSASAESANASRVGVMAAEPVSVKKVALKHAGQPATSAHISSAPGMSALANRNFVKMNGLGNEIVVVDMRPQGLPISAGEVR